MISELRCLSILTRVDRLRSGTSESASGVRQPNKASKRWKKPTEERVLFAGAIEISRSCHCADTLLPVSVDVYLIGGYSLSG